ncbi:hypothetical protein C8Q80DRAFT_473071 [Daedaleopsis nitida]|nr:hypothetical protein C8Q80DRAFT_473071 [Daedaleopsis nitida]
MNCNMNMNVVNVQGPSIRLAPSPAFPNAPSTRIFPLPYGVGIPGLSVHVDFDSREVFLNVNCQVPLEAISGQGPVMAAHPHMGSMAFPVQRNMSLKQEKQPKGDPPSAPHKVRPAVAAAEGQVESHIIGSGLPPAVPRTHQIRHGPSPSFRAELQTARRSGLPVSRGSSRADVDARSVAGSDPASESSVVKVEKVKPEKGTVKSEPVKKAVKSEKVRVAAKLAKTPGKARMATPQRHEKNIRKTQHATVWYSSTYHEKLPEPPASVAPARNDVYVHYYGPADSQRVQIWLATARSGAVRWRRVQHGISHPDADADSDLANYVLLVRSAHSVAWVTEGSARKHNRQILREGLQPILSDP